MLEERNSSLTTDLHVEATYRLTEELVAAQHRMQRRVELLSEVVFETDASGALVFLNNAWRQALGLASEASIGRPLADFVHPEDRASLAELLRPSKSSAEPSRPWLRFLCANGVDVWMEISVAFLGDGGTVGAMRNVTRQRQTQAEIEKLSLVASFTDNLVIITDAEGRIEWVNQAFSIRTEYQLDEVIGCKPGDILQGPETDRKAVQRISESLRQGRSFQSELVNYSKSGKAYWTSLQVTPIRNQQGEVERYISVQTDSTERRKIQLELESARERAETANLAKTQFLANISHEMRTPLNAILGYSDLATEAHVSLPELGGYLGKVREGAEVLLRLITDLLDVSNLEAGQIDVEEVAFDLRQCIQESLAGMAEKAERSQLTFRLDYDPALPARIIGDPQRLRKIVASLAENAVKFTDTGGVVVCVRSAQGGPEQSSQLEIKVSDTGIGIVEAQQTRVFEHFERVDSSTTRKRGGLGIGLSMVKSLAEALGGSISLQSVPGVGSAFTVLLPLRPVEAPVQLTANRPLQLQSPRLRPARVLIAEDTDTNFLILEKMLSHAGIESQRARTGQMAVDLVAGNHFDLILMDIEMPEMDGLQAVRLIRDREAARGLDPVPILAFTAYATRGSRESCVAAGCTGFLNKPIRKHELLQAVSQVIGELQETEPATPAEVKEEGPFVSVDPELLEFVPMFLEHCHSQLQRLKTAIEARDAQQAARIGHDLKGCAPGVGFDAIGRLGATMEVAAKANAFAELQACADSLGEYLSSVRYR